MSTDGRGGSGGAGAPGGGGGNGRNGGGPVRLQGNHSGDGGGGGIGRKKRRRQRGQRNKKRVGVSPSPHGDNANRERVYQDIEGLLRQIRELAEETSAYSQERLDEFTQVVMTLFKALEGEGEMVSDRLYGEYLRVRDKLNLALKEQAPPDHDTSA